MPEPPPLPDLEAFEYRLVKRPEGAKLRAWPKLEECERRLALYRWAEQLNDPAQPHYRVLLDDSESALLLSLEATLQFLKDERHPHAQEPFEKWITRQPEYDVVLRGLRTLRHLEAHVEATTPGSVIIVRVGGGDLIRRRWRLQRLEETDLARLKSHPLQATELNQWNDLVTRESAATLLEHGVVAIAAILARAEVTSTAGAG